MGDRGKVHWFWRAGTAVVVGSVYGGLSVTLLEDDLYRLSCAIQNHFGGGASSNPWWSHVVSWAVVYCLPVVLVALGISSIMTRFLGPYALLNPQTRCRQCGYLLRTISEPRCPKCGEQI